MSAFPTASDDGSRVSAHFLNPLLKVSTPSNFETGLALNSGLDKKAKEAAAAYLRDLTSSRQAFFSKLDSSAANMDAELDNAVSAYLSLLLGLVNSYAETNTTALDQETGQPDNMQ